MSRTEEVKEAFKVASQTLKNIRQPTHEEWQQCPVAVLEYVSAITILADAAGDMLELVVHKLDAEVKA